MKLEEIEKQIKKIEKKRDPLTTKLMKLKKERTKLQNEIQMPELNQYIGLCIHDPDLSEGHWDISKILSIENIDEDLHFKILKIGAMFSNHHISISTIPVNIKMLYNEKFLIDSEAFERRYSELLTKMNLKSTERSNKVSDLSDLKSTERSNKVSDLSDLKSIIENGENRMLELEKQGIEFLSPEQYNEYMAIQKWIGQVSYWYDNRPSIDNIANKLHEQWVKQIKFLFDAGFEIEDDDMHGPVPEGHRDFVLPSDEYNNYIHLMKSFSELSDKDKDEFREWARSIILK